MAIVTWIIPAGRPEISLTLPDMEGRDLRPWPYRGGSTRNLVVALPPGIPRIVPANVAMMLAGLRRRGSFWIDVRMRKGEYQALLPYCDAIWTKPPRGLESSRRGARARRRRLQRRALVAAHGAGLKARDFLQLLAPNHREAIWAAPMKPMSVSNAEGHEMYYDPMRG